MTTNPSQRLELSDLVDAVCEDSLSPAALERLESLLLADDDACRYYLDYLSLHGTLLLAGQPPATCDVGYIGKRRDADGSMPAALGSGFRIRESDAASRQSAAPPIILDLSPTPGSSLFTLQSPVGSFIFSHLTAAVLLTIGLLIGWTWTIHHDRLLVDNSGATGGSSASAQIRAGKLPVPPAVEKQRVGQITDLADCRWADPKNEAARGDLVPLGHQYALASGLMEITYDTGAKVILHGPCTYDVDSTAGGYLSIGKLTAYVKAKTQTLRPYVGSAVELPNQQDATGSKGERTANLAGKRGQSPFVRSTLRAVPANGDCPLFPAEPTTSLALRPLVVERSFNRKPSASEGRLAALADGSRLNETAGHSPLFSVRTPTAVVTDLGTEFGVEVTHSGATRSHVFRGLVEVRSGAAGGVVELRANESATVEAGQHSAVQVDRGEDRSVASEFVREMPRRAIAVEGQTAGRTSHHSSYRLTDLGALGGATSHAAAMNAAGQVVGEAATATGAKHAFLYSSGKMKDLGALGGANSNAFGINALGQVAGGSDVGDNGYRAFLFSDGTMTDLGTLGGATSCAFAINDAGQVVGASLNSDRVQHAFLYARSEGMKNLGARGGRKAESQALGINADGLVVGYSKISSGLTHAFLTGSAGSMNDLGVLGGNRSMAHRVNAVGQVVGVSTVAKGIDHAFLYDRETGMKDLGTLGGPSSRAFDINNVGQVVGMADGVIDAARVPLARPLPRSRAFLYSGGKMIDLNSLVGPAGGWHLVAASAINDTGQIAGFGNAPGGNVHAFLLTPLSEQETRR